jgi:alanyl-tRNA synthetase
MPDISQEELDRLKAADESAKKLAAKNVELLEEKKAEKARADKAEKDKADAEAAALKEKGDFKTLSEKLEADKKASDEKAAKLEADRVADIKKGAFSAELDKLGIIPERKSFILGSVDVSTLQYIEESKVVLGADAKAKEILTQMPEIFGKPGNNLPGQGGGSGGNGGGGGSPAHMSPEWWAKLSIADQDKYRADYFKAQGIPYKPRQ